MPKSGGWLNSVKVCLGFLELALALKFLSAADLVWHWEWFDREVFLSLWIVIFVLMGVYLLGKLQILPWQWACLRFWYPGCSLPCCPFHLPYIWFPVFGGHQSVCWAGWPRRWIPRTSCWMAADPVAAASDTGFPAKVKYDEVFKKPVGFTPFFDLEEGLAYAKKVNRPVMLDFTGWACTNCRRMEDNVWVKPEVGNLIREYVLIQLYVDERKIKMPADKGPLFGDPAEKDGWPGLLERGFPGE